MENIDDGRRPLDAMCNDIVEQYHAPLHRLMHRIDGELAAFAAACPSPVSRALREIFAALEDQINGHMAKEEHLVFPALSALAPAACWTGALDLTFDRAPSIGTTGARGNVYYALGYSGHGLALGMQAGRVIADLYAGDRDAWRGFPFYQRRMPRIPPEPLRWIGYQAYTRLTGRSPRR